MLGNTSNTKLLMHCKGDTGVKSTIDDRTGDYDLTIVGTPEFKIAGPTGHDFAMEFDGSTEYMYLPNLSGSFGHPIFDASLYNSNCVTYSIWVKHDDHAGTETYYLDYKDANNYAWLRHVHGIGLTFTMLRAGVTKISLAGGEITDTDWHHVALVRMAGAGVATECWAIYLDGVQVAYTTNNDYATITGGHGYIANGLSSPFDGQFSDFFITTSNYFGAIPVVGLTDTITPPGAQYFRDNNALIHIPFEGDAAIGGASRHVVKAAASIIIDSDQVPNSNYRGSYHLDGSASYLELADSADWDIFADKAEDWTIDFWFKLDTNAKTESFVYQYEDGSNYFIIAKSTTQLIVRFYTGGVMTLEMLATVSFNTSWHHLAFVKKGGVLAEYGLYLDGEQVGYLISSAEDNFTGVLYLFGNTTGTLALDGYVTEFRIEKDNVFSASPQADNSDVLAVPGYPYYQFPGNWSDKREIKVDPQYVYGTSDLTNFPLLLKDGNFPDAVYNNSEADGKDLRFTTDEEGNNELSFEIEKWDTGAKEGIVWVKIPTLSYNDFTSIWVWFDNPSATAYDEEDEFGLRQVWEEYASVYHLSDLTTSTIKDATWNQNGGTKKGANEPIEAIGEVYESQDFDGTDDYINCDILYANFQQNYPIYAFKTIGFWIYANSDTKKVLQLDGSTSIEISSGTITLTGFTSPTIYVNGEVGSTITASAWYYVTITDSTTFDCLAFILGKVSTDFFDGKLEEVRLYPTERSAEWIKTEYYNMALYSSFLAGTTTGAVTSGETGLTKDIKMRFEAFVDYVFMTNGEELISSNDGATWDTDNLLNTLDITNVSYSDPTITLTVESGHEVEAGDSIVVSGLSPSGYNGTFTVTAVTDTTIEYTSTGLAAVTDAIGSLTFQITKPANDLVLYQSQLYLIGLKGYPSDILWSNTPFLDGSAYVIDWSKLNNVSIKTNDGEALIAGHVYRGNLYLFKNNSIFRAQAPIGTYGLKQLTGNIGANSKDCIQEVSGQLIFFCDGKKNTKKGFYSYDSLSDTEPQIISEAIQHYIDGIIDGQEVIAGTLNNLYVAFVGNVSNSTYNIQIDNCCLVFNAKTNKWLGAWGLQSPVKYMAQLVESENGFLSFGDNNGKIWQLNEGNVDAYEDPNTSYPIEFHAQSHVIDLTKGQRGTRGNFIKRKVKSIWVIGDALVGSKFRYRFDPRETNQDGWNEVTLNKDIQEIGIKQTMAFLWQWEIRGINKSNSMPNVRMLIINYE